MSQTSWFKADSSTVPRAMPQMDAAGNVTLWRYELMFREVGHDQGMQFVQPISSATAEQPHGESIMLEDEHGNDYIANAIEPAIAPWRRSSSPTGGLTRRPTP